MNFDVVLIGSGISSLTCATILAKKGYSVCVLEQYKKPGGYLHSFKRFGYTYETGAHYAGCLEPGETFHTLLTYMGVMDPELFSPLDENAFDVFQFADFEFSFPRGYERLSDKLCSRFPGDAEGIRRYLDMISSIVTYFQTYHFRKDLQLNVLMEALETPLKKVIEGLVRDPQLQCILYGHCYLHGVKPADVSFGLHALMMDSIVRSPYGFPKGGDAVADKFVKRITELGGEVRLGTRVVRLHVEGKSVREVELESGERLTAKQFISSAHPKSTFALLEPNPLPPGVKNRMEKVAESTAIFGIYAEMEGESVVNPRRNYYHFAHREPSGMLCLEPYEDTPSVVFVARPDRNAPPAERYPLIFHSPGPVSWFGEWQGSRLGKRPEAYKAKKEELAGRVLSFMERRMPGLRASMKRFETSTALTNLHFNGSEEGSGYGIYHSMENTGMRAIGPRTRVENLFLTGQSVLMPGLLGAATSGLRTAGELVGLGNLLDELITIRDA